MLSGPLLAPSNGVAGVAFPGSPQGLGMPCGRVAPGPVALWPVNAAPALLVGKRRPIPHVQSAIRSHQVALPASAAPRPVGKSPYTATDPDRLMPWPGLPWGPGRLAAQVFYGLPCRCGAVRCNHGAGRCQRGRSSRQWRALMRGLRVVVDVGRECSACPPWRL